MKKLLFLTNLGFCIFITSCHSQSNKTETNAANDTLSQKERKEVIQINPTSTDTSKSVMENVGASSTNNSDTTKSRDDKYKDKPKEFTNPKHGNPNPQELDSIKKSKQKQKK